MKGHFLSRSVILILFSGQNVMSHTQPQSMLVWFYVMFGVTQHTSTSHPDVLLLSQVTTSMSALRDPSTLPLLLCFAELVYFLRL